MSRGRPGPRMADLSASLDTARLAERALDLNVSLMKWRMWPTLDTDALRTVKCLLLGAGTLGCAVSILLLY
jgi:ubiquitin-like modifier-activating enzyme ATG7